MATVARDTTIDFFRGIAIIAMIFIHTSYYFLEVKFVQWTWEYLQFAVPVFVFCSAYLFFIRETHFTVAYLQKRFVRLLKPYYIFLLFFIPLIWWKDHTSVTSLYILKSLYVWDGGVEISWLVLLFLQFTFLVPFIQWSERRNTFVYGAFASATIISSIILMFYKFPYNWRYIMWLPWSVILLFGLYYARLIGKKWFAPTVLFVSSVMYFILLAWLRNLHITTSLYDNKYPPTLYFLAFGIACIIALYYLEKITPKFIHKIIHFFSVYSYPIFFIHYWVLTFFQSYLKTLHFTWWSFFGVVVGVTIIIQIAINRIQLRFKPLHS